MDLRKKSKIIEKLNKNKFKKIFNKKKFNKSKMSLVNCNTSLTELKGSKI